MVLIEGDALLVDAAEAWRHVLRPSDFLARLGGDEFVVLLPDIELEHAELVVDRLRATTPRGQTASVGIVSWSLGEDSDAVLARADRRLMRQRLRAGIVWLRTRHRRKWLSSSRNSPRGRRVGNRLTGLSCLERGRPRKSRRCRFPCKAMRLSGTALVPTAASYPSRSPTGGDHPPGNVCPARWSVGIRWARGGGGTLRLPAPASSYLSGVLGARL